MKFKKNIKIIYKPVLVILFIINLTSCFHRCDLAESIFIGKSINEYISTSHNYPVEVRLEGEGKVYIFDIQTQEIVVLPMNAPPLPQNIENRTQIVQISPGRNTVLDWESSQPFPASAKPAEIYRTTKIKRLYLHVKTDQFNITQSFHCEDR